MVRVSSLLMIKRLSVHLIESNTHTFVILEGCFVGSGDKVLIGIIAGISVSRWCGEKEAQYKLVRRAVASVIASHHHKLLPSLSRTNFVA